VLAAAATVRVLRRRALPLHVLPLGLATVAVLSAVGPWSVMSVARRSQQARLEAAMTRAGIAWDARAVGDTIIPNEPFREISETVRYLHTHFGAGALPPLFARHAGSRTERVDVVHAAGLRPVQAELEYPRAGFAQLAPGSALGQSAAGHLHYVRIEGRAPRSPGDSADADLARVPVSVAGTTLFADLTVIADGLYSRPRGGALPPEAASIALRDADGRERGTLHVLEIGLGDSPVRVHLLSGVASLPAM
jgi:hypothetical protein